MVLREVEASAGRQVGTGHQRSRCLTALQQIAEGGAAEQNLVVVVGRQFRTPVAKVQQAAPVARAQGTRHQFALHVALQKARFVLGEQALAVQRIGQRRETAARHARDHIDLVEHPVGVALDHDRRATQLFQHAVRQRGSARAATRERQQHHRIRTVVGPLLVFEQIADAVAALLVGLRDRRIARHQRVATGQRQHNQRSAGAAGCARQRSLELDSCSDHGPLLVAGRL